ncbi:PLP-dependent aminotransferase family protein [Vibrio albus]|uniref:PLP-dependent aminotransferase family protein n=1 Tax=Vibrio albus TaxID=2200953 RepID=A0A2U3BA74_9VIBR|nr:PLP-dependent aminotransferase family protein [Vibrio albus]PWI33692.1 PLP-dependent aminotransferase family protein [Vibrio albus]
MLQSYIQIDPSDNRTLQDQIRGSISQAISEGFIPKDTCLVSSRKLAQSLKVSRNTVLRVYEQLTEDGLLVPVERKGYFVNPELELSPKMEAVPAATSQDNLNWNNYLLTDPEQLNHEQHSNLSNTPYQFINGLVDEKLFPASEWRKCSIQSLNRVNNKSWTSNDCNYNDLIEQIRTRVLPKRGIFVKPEQIAITFGCQNSLYLISKLLVSRYSTIGMENPGYPEALQQFQTRRASIIPIDVDRQGMQVDERLDPCQLVYTTPSNQFPTTVRLSTERRKKLMEKAEEQDLLIIEDDFEHDISYIEDHSPALRGEYNSERIIYISSFSSTIAPGLRLGYIVASEPLIKQIKSLQMRTHSLPPKNNCQTMALFLSLGYYDALLQKMLKRYREKWLTMEKALNYYFPQSGVIPSLAGTSFWINCKEGFDAPKLQQLAEAHGILINCGSRYYIAGAKTNSFRLSFQSIRTEHIREGIKQLSKLAKRILPVPRLEETAGIRLNTQRIRELLSGCAIFTQDCFNIPYRITFQPDGKMTGISDRPNDVDEGYWWVKDNKLCYQWRNWQFADTRTLTIIQDGHILKRFGEDGFSVGEASLVEPSQPAR